MPHFVALQRPKGGSIDQIMKRAKGNRVVGQQKRHRSTEHDAWLTKKSGVETGPRLLSIRLNTARRSNRNCNEERLTKRGSPLKEINIKEIKRTSSSETKGRTLTEDFC